MKKQDNKRERIKLLIEIDGGMIQNVISTKEIDIYIVDHDNIKEKGEDTIIAETPIEPDKICYSESFPKKLKEALKNYKEII